MKIIITHSETKLNVEKHFDVSITIGTLKEKLYSISGTTVDDMKLELRDQNGKTILSLSDDQKTLKDYGVKEYQEVHIIDSDVMKTVKNMTDLTGVKKYTISEDDYNKRDDTFRKWKKASIGQKEKKKEKIDEKYLEKPDGIKVGDRCEWKQRSFKPRGEIKYIGKVSSLGDGYWIGVKLDEPYGNSDGMLKKKRYFKCEKKFAIFTRFDNLNVGDYPEETFDSCDEDEI